MEKQKLFARLKFRWLWLIGAPLVLFLFGYNSFTVYIRPGQYGVKQVIVGAGQGIHPETFAPGVHFLTPGVERMHVMPAELQVLEMSDIAANRSEHAPTTNVRQVPAIKIQTSEGYTVSVDITVLYRIEDPYKVITQIGPGRAYEDSAVIPRSEQQLRRKFGELDAEQFYQGDHREKAALEAQRLLSEELTPKGLHITHVLVRQYRYDKRYQAAIESRKIQDQTVFKNRAEAAAASEEAKKNTIVAEGAAAVATELARGEAEVKKIKSAADLYRRTKEAEGSLKVELAKATGTDLENRALRGVGSDNMVGLKMAAALKGVEAVVLPSDGEGGTNPLDLGQMLKRFQVKGE